MLLVVACAPLPAETGLPLAGWRGVEEKDVDNVSSLLADAVSGFSVSLSMDPTTVDGRSTMHVDAAGKTSPVT